MLKVGINRAYSAISSDTWWPFFLRKERIKAAAIEELRKDTLLHLSQYEPVSNEPTQSQESNVKNNPRNLWDFFPCIIQDRKDDNDGTVFEVLKKYYTKKEEGIIPKHMEEGLLNFRPRFTAHACAVHPNATSNPDAESQPLSSPCPPDPRRSEADVLFSDEEKNSEPSVNYEDTKKKRAKASPSKPSKPAPTKRRDYSPGSRTKQPSKTSDPAVDHSEQRDDPSLSAAEPPRGPVSMDAEAQQDEPSHYDEPASATPPAGDAPHSSEQKPQTAGTSKFSTPNSKLSPSTGYVAGQGNGVHYPRSPPRSAQGIVVDGVVLATNEHNGDWALFYLGSEGPGSHDRHRNVPTQPAPLLAEGAMQGLERRAAAATDGGTPLAREPFGLRQSFQRAAGMKQAGVSAVLPKMTPAKDELPPRL